MEGNPSVGCVVSEKTFKLMPIENKCVCKNGYELIDGKCLDKCGDGVIQNQECDDGNTVNSDGCSSKCRK